ncbi:MAG: SixA phosphatase family protein [Steroidobacteraceae bacterium]
MELILWRHADAADGAPDAARPLTDRGRRQAEAMARWLTPRLPAELRILVSPARRAQQTARALERPFETSEDLSTGADVNALLHAARWPDAAGAVLVVGHQPTLGETAALLLAGRESAWRIAKGAVWWLRGRKRGNAAETVLMLALEPEMLEAH